jgi:hypothetical protein
MTLLTSVLRLSVNLEASAIFSFSLLMSSDDGGIKQV